jgi:hypothetical protein
MFSLCPEVVPGRCPLWRRPSLATLPVLLSMLLPGAAPQAQETWFQPEISLRAEQNTNRNLSTVSENEQDTAGYVLDGTFTWGHVTPTSNTRLRPRLRLQRYPDRSDINNSEQFLDFNTRYQGSERTTLSLVARYSRRDAFNTELADAEFDEFDPEDPEVEDTGLVIGANTRTLVRLRPQFQHDLSVLSSIRLQGILRSTRFDDELERQQVNFDYGELGADWVRRLDQRNSIAVGPYVSRYETRDDRNTTDSIGVNLEWRRDWTPLFETAFVLTAEHTDIELRTEPGVEDFEFDIDTGQFFDEFGQPLQFVTTSTRSTDVGARVFGVRRFETSRLQFDLSRRFNPSASGAKVIANEFRVQYEQSLTERVSFTGAVRTFTRRPQGGRGGAGRDYARSALALQWMVTPTWFVRGGHNYTWQDRARDDGSADNHTLYVEFGYRGLGRQGNRR